METESFTLQNIIDQSGQYRLISIEESLLERKGGVRVLLVLFFSSKHDVER